MPYEVILFDADETLFDFKKAERDALKNTLLEFETLIFKVVLTLESIPVGTIQVRP